MVRPIFETEMEITGPWRTPVNMLSQQTYDGHASLHDDETASKLGHQILVGTASVGPAHPPSELDVRVTRMERPAVLFFLDQLAVGQRSAAAEHVVMDFDQHLGSLYPFTLREKLANITEHLRWHAPVTGERSPWGRPVIQGVFKESYAGYPKDRLR